MRIPAGAARALGLAWALSSFAGCAAFRASLPPSANDPAAYVGWSCERLFGEMDVVQQRAADVAYAVDSRVGNNMISLGVGITVFWPALMAMRPTGIDAMELTALRGRFDAMQLSAARKGCEAPAPSPPAATDAAAMLPVAQGDRLVYEDRVGTAGSLHELGMRVTALHRDQIEFRLDLDGKALAPTWRQDLAGNAVPEPRPAMLGWQHLLRRDLALGQVLSGELAAANEPKATARLRGQVVATGPQEMAGRSFDVAVIELFGEAPKESRDGAASTRLDGVMAVDRRSGVVLRLELRCANSQFALRRRLLRVESGQQ
jgi:hypothetical protein